MSSISSGSANDPSKIREYYAHRENEIEDKHRTEVENLKKAQSQDMENLRTQAGSQIDEAKEGFKEKLTDMDRKHQSEIEGLKAMYQKKLEESARKNKSES